MDELRPEEFPRIKNDVYEVIIRMDKHLPKQWDQKANFGRELSDVLLPFDKADWDDVDAI
jgi:hypothetical protein